MAFFLKLFNSKDSSTTNSDAKLLRDKFKELPAVAHKAFKSSGLTASEVIKEWDLFVYCLYTNCKGLSLKMVNGNLTLSEKDLFQQSNDNSKKTKSSERSDGTEMDTLTKEPLLSDDEQSKKNKNEDETANSLFNSDPKEFYNSWNKIGDGAFGTVQSAQDIATGRMVAVKLVRRSYQEHKERILNEIYILRTSNHPNIVPYVRSFLYRDHVSIVTDFCDAGSLRGIVSLGLKEDMIIYIIWNVLQGLSYMHSLGRIHRDIKSSNVLVTTGGEIKICDMGLSTDSKNTGMAGSKFWCAPEMIRKLKYDNKVDIWSLGALTYELAEKRPPYREFRSLKALFYTVTVGAPALSKARKFSPQFKDFLNNCFKQDPLERPSAEQLKKHEIFNRVMRKDEFARHLRFLLVAQTFSGI